MSDSTRPENVVRRSGHARSPKRLGNTGPNPARNLHTVYQHAVVLALADVADALPASFADLAQQATQHLEALGIAGTVTVKNALQLVGAAGVKADAKDGHLISIDEGSLTTAKARYGVQEVPAS